MVELLEGGEGGGRRGKEGEGGGGEGGERDLLRPTTPPCSAHLQQVNLLNAVLPSLRIHHVEDLQQAGIT